jgi:hypothetical protein
MSDIVDMLERGRPPTEAALTSFDYHRPSDNAQGTLTVSNLNGEVGVVRGTESLPETVRGTANGVSARLLCIRELKAPLVLLQLSV